MKFKTAGLASTALLLLSPISGALTTIAEPSVVQAENNWDYDTANPSLGDYDKLLQNAGPSDGIVDWYPTKDALSNNPTGQDLVKQLIELSIATNNANSNARNVLFNDTNGANDRESYQDTYNKYSLAFGFIAQLLDFNNEKTGLGAQLAQGVVSGDNDPIDPHTNKSVIVEAVSQKPRKGQGHTIADVLGKAFFGNADDAYAQIYLNGYDNVAQNETNIIREATSSITIVAVSKLTGHKATAIFKLNNKTLPTAPANIRLNNYHDDSVYALDDNQDGIDIAGLNMTTASQSTIDRIKFSKESTFWVNDNQGGGTIVVPRGTTAQQIAELIAKKQLTSNNTLQESAPMKAIQAVNGTNANGEEYSEGITHSYSHLYSRGRKGAGNTSWGHANDIDGDSNIGGVFNYATKIPYGINGPMMEPYEMKEYNNLFNGKEGINKEKSSVVTQLRNDGSKQFVTTDAQYAVNSWFGGTASDKAKGSGHMLDTNTFDWTLKTASTIPNVERSEGNPYNVEGTLPYPSYMGESDSKVAGASTENGRNTNVGKVQHLFQPKSYFKEAYDANHFLINSPEMQDMGVNQIAHQIANNGSFSDTTVAGGIKKSFTYEASGSAWIYKSYNNPYSTVMSSAGAQTVDGGPVNPESNNSTIKPQTKFNPGQPHNPDPDENEPGVVSIEPGSGITSEVESAYRRPILNRKYYFYLGTYQYNSGNQNYSIEIKKDEQNPTNPKGANPIGIKFLAGNGGTVFKYGAVGIDGENNTNDETGDDFAIESAYGSDHFTGPDRPNLAHYTMNENPFLFLRNGIYDFRTSPFNRYQVRDDSQFFVQVWDKNTHIKDPDGNFVSDPKPLIYNQNAGEPTETTLGQVDSPNFEAKYYLTGLVEIDTTNGQATKMLFGDHLAQTATSKRAYFNSNLYNNPDGDLTKGSNKNNSRFFVSQDFAIGPVSADMINDAGPEGSGIMIDGEYYPYGKSDHTNGKTPEENAAQILKLAVMYNNPKSNGKNGEVKSEFTEAAGYKLVSIGDAAGKQGVSEATLAEEVAKVTGKSAQEVKNTKWVEATLPRLKRNAGKARINIVVYDQVAVPAPTKAETKPSFSTTDVSTGNDPFNVNLRPYTTTYDDGAVLKGADVPQSFKNLLSNTLVAGNADLVDHPNRLEQVLVSAFLNSWQQNDGSFDQTDTAVGVNSPLYLYGGFGISNSDTKNSYSQWPNGYTTNTGDYLTATSHYSGDFYRGGKDLQLVRGGTVKGIPVSALKADVSKVDLSKAGTYPVVYTYTNPNNTKDSASITVPVTVKDAAAPVFAFQGGSDLTIRVGDSFDRSAYKVVGNWQIFNKYEGDYNKLVSGEGIATGSDGKLQVTITGEVDTNTPGVYQVTYEATNLSGIKAKMVRKINVLPQETGNNWKVSDFISIGYINYTPGYSINVWNAPAGTFTGQRLTHGTSWKIFQKAVNRQGKVYYQVGKNQWLDGQYVSFTPVSTMQPLNGVVTINYVPGYGVNLWKAPKTTGGYHEGRKLKHGTQWKVFGLQDGFYKVGGNQWIQAKYTKLQAK